MRWSGVAANGTKVQRVVQPGEVARVPLGTEQILTAQGKVPGGARARGEAAHGGACGVVIDARPRPWDGPTRCLLPRNAAAASDRSAPADAGPQVYRGPVRLRRELAIPGEVLVGVGDAVAPDTLVARSVRRFLRPFFLNVAEAIKVPPSELERHLEKRVGDDIAQDEVIARRRDRLRWAKAFRSPVAGKLEKILPSGTLVVREQAEAATELTAVNAAKELGVRPARLKPYLRCREGQEIEKGQWIAAALRPGHMKVCPSPVRGRVRSIEAGYGIVLIEPLLEELDVLAWMPGSVAEVSDRGCVVENEATVVQGVWGSGGETWGELSLDAAGKGVIAVRPSADAAELGRLAGAGAAGLITAGVNLKDVTDAPPPFTVVVTDGFAATVFSGEIRGALASHAGSLALIDGTTRLRVGVERPRIILPGQP